MALKHYIFIAAILMGVVTLIYFGYRSGGIALPITNDRQLTTDEVSSLTDMEETRPSIADQGTNVHAVEFTGGSRAMSDNELIEAYKDIGANSLEEARWLRVNGYPTFKQLVEYQKLSPYELEQKAKDGDIVAKAMLGLKLSASPNPEQGIDLLVEASIEGSVFSLNVLSDIYGDNSRLKNPVLAEAYTRAAQLRGDYAIAHKPGRSLNTVDYVLSNLHAQMIIDNLNESRVRSGLRPFTYHPRPGARQAYERAIAAIKQHNYNVSQEPR